MLAESFFAKFVEDSFTTFNPELTSLTFADAIICFFWSILLSFAVAITYRATHRGLSYSQSFTQTLVLLGVIVSIVMLIVGTDIARAFTLVGALSIVRFRNAVKETRDVGFIFFSMVIGMACGTRFFALGIIFTFVGCGLLYSMYMGQFGQKNYEQDILELTIAKEFDFSASLPPIFTGFLRDYSVLGVDALDEATNRITFMVTFKKKQRLFSRLARGPSPEEFGAKAQLLAALQKIATISDIKLINGANSTEI